jgi:hypothetical protein
MYEHVMKSQPKEYGHHQLLMAREASSNNRQSQPELFKPHIQMKYPELVSPLEDLIKLQKVVNDPKLALVQVRETIGML